MHIGFRISIVVQQSALQLARRTVNSVQQANWAFWPIGDTRTDYALAALLKFYFKIV
jgi:hypothetical protein